MYTYSKTDQVTSQQLLDTMKSMLTAAGQFLKQLPVKRYTFLYHFEDQSWGAWEHSYSSEYVLKETPYSKELADDVTSIAAHEFFHVVTPLNIHSEIIQQFNFVTPRPSEHLWLYEGVTEWASQAMQLRGGLLDLPTYLGKMTQKIGQDKSYDSTYSLAKLGLTCYSKLGITYTPATPTGRKTVTMGMNVSYLGGDSKIVLTNVSEPMRQAGVRENDEWVRFNGQPVRLDNTTERRVAIGQMKGGDTYTVTVRREGQEVTLRLPILERELIERYRFSLNPQATPQQLELREAWMKNL